MANSLPMIGALTKFSTFAAAQPVPATSSDEEACCRAPAAALETLPLPTTTPRSCEPLLAQSFSVDSAAIDHAATGALGSACTTGADKVGL